MVVGKQNFLKIFEDANALFLYAAEDFARRAIKAVEDQGVFRVVLAGGNTPKLLYDQLSHSTFKKKLTPWQHIQFFFGDERYVSANHIDSNYHMAMTHLFSKLPILKENIFPIPTKFSDPKEAAKQYALTLKKVFQLQGDETPQFDLIYLGLGEDAHTASLFPGTELVNYYAKAEHKSPIDVSVPIPIDTPFVADLSVSQPVGVRITLTPRVINHAEHVIFLVTGENKALAVSQVLNGPRNPLKYPAQLIQCEEHQTIWFLDKAAASEL